MATRAELEQALTRMPNADEATVVGEQSLIATVGSGSFRDQNEAQRQETVWSYLRRGPETGPAATDAGARPSTRLTPSCAPRSP
jgi:hypothetical protein